MNAVIHIYNRPAYIFEVADPKKAIHLSYHQGNHYNSVRWIDDINDNIPRQLPTYVESAITIEEGKEIKEQNNYQSIIEDEKEILMEDRNNESMAITEEDVSSSNKVLQEELKEFKKEESHIKELPKDDNIGISIDEAIDYAFMILQDKIKYSLKQAILNIFKDKEMTIDVLLSNKNRMCITNLMIY